MEDFKNLTLKQVRNKLAKIGFKDFDFKISLMIHNNDEYELKETDPLVKQYRKAQSKPGQAFWMLEQPIQYISYREGKEVDLDLNQVLKKRR
jgi:hypothetical protein